MHYKGSSSHCWKAENFLIWKNWDYGIFAWPDKKVLISNSILADNKISLALHVFGPNVLSHAFRDNSIIVKDSLLIGQSMSFNCIIDSIIPDHASNFPQRINSRPSPPKGGRYLCVMQLPLGR